MTETRKQLLIICPVYNEEVNIDYFFGRLTATLAQLDTSRYAYRLLFTNNRSTDGTLAKIHALEAKHDWIGHITLSRNHGYQLSLLSGLTTVEADLYMVCDVDCEDPPEMLHPLLATIEQGHDYAYGIRNNRPDPWLLGKMRRAFYFTLGSLGDYKIIPFMSEFAVFRRQVRDSLIRGQNSFPFLRAEVGYAGFSIQGVPYRREARKNGVSHYNWVGNFRFATAGILSSTTFPLRMMLYTLAPAVIWIAGWCGQFATGLAGFEATVVSLLAGGLTYLCVGTAFLAVYLARTYQNGLGRARFNIDPNHTSLPDAAHPQAVAATLAPRARAA
jgi:glycosyltransferase involved in cell wall biosynthesis